jgi:hypothetical protein
MYAFVWVDRDRHFFITNTSSLATGCLCERVRMRQVQPVETDLPPEQIQFSIAQQRQQSCIMMSVPRLTGTTGADATASAFKGKIETHNWSKRVNFSIFGMIVVDCFLVYSQLVKDETENDFCQPCRGID